jgi:hypothetical protein
MTMRGQDYENKQRAGTFPVPRFEPVECQPGHKLFKGRACPSCGLAIPVGPYTPQQMGELFGSQLYLGQHPASVGRPEEEANPITERELELRRELKAMNDRAQDAKLAISAAEAKGDRAAVAAARDHHHVAASEIPLIARAIRREEAQRAGRIRSWLIKHHAR